MSVSSCMVFATQEYRSVKINVLSVVARLGRYTANQLHQLWSQSRLINPLTPN